jgi:hypothetical protein
VIGVAATLGFSWWQGSLRQSSSAAHVGILVAIAVVLGSAIVFGRGRQAMTTGSWIRGPITVRRHLADDPRATVAALVWVGLVLAVIGWDLNSFAHQSHDLPTLSWIVGHVTSRSAGRGVLVALWLGLGASLALGWRRAR